jgi:maleamate amidohydrolase
MSLDLPQDDPWVSRGYGQGAIEPGERPAVLVIDLQYAFTDPQFPLGGAPLVELDSRWSQVDERVWDDSDVLLVKKWPSFFHGTPLCSLLTAAQRDTVIVTGCMTSGCVRATTVDAFSYGFRTLVPEDCVGDQGEAGHESNLRDVHRRYAEVTSADEVIAYLERVPAEVAR